MTLRYVSWRAVSTREQAEDDKASLPAQDIQHRAFVEQQGGRLVADLVVPGHSRSYVDFYELAEDAAKAGIPAFKEFQRLCDARAFDVLLLRGGDRLAREQAPIAYMVSRVIHSGARLFSFQDGWVDEKNYRMIIAMWGYSASSEVDNLKVRFASGKRKNTLEKGVFTNGKPPFGFKQVRSELGKLVATEIDESCRPIFNDAARLVLERVTWRDISEVMHVRFGHINPRTGKPFTRMFFYHWFHNPWIWGHAAQLYKAEDTPNGQKAGIWTFDDTALPPPGVRIEYNRRAPVFDGDLALKLKAELRRRRMFEGGARPNTAHLFTGLILCGYCGFYLVHDHDKSGAGYYRCHSKYSARSRPGCDRYRYIREDVVIEWVDRQLQYMIEHSDPTLLAQKPDAAAPREVLEDLNRQLAKVEVEISTLIRKQAKVSDELADLYDTELQALADRRRAVKRQIDEIERLAREQDMSEVIQAFEDYRLVKDRFWQQDRTAVNQHLHRIFGGRRMVMLDNEIVAVTDAPPISIHRHGKRKKRKHPPTV